MLLLWNVTSLHNACHKHVVPNCVIATCHVSLSCVTVMCHCHVLFILIVSYSQPKYFILKAIKTTSCMVSPTGTFNLETHAYY